MRSPWQHWEDSCYREQQKFCTQSFELTFYRPFEINNEGSLMAGFRISKGRFVWVNFSKLTGQQPNFQEWLFLHSLSPLENFNSNYWVLNFCSLWFPARTLSHYLLNDGNHLMKRWPWQRVDEALTMATSWWIIVCENQVISGISYSIYISCVIRR